MGVKIFVTLDDPDPKTSARQNKIISLLVTFSVPHVLVNLTAKDRERGDQIEFMNSRAKKREGQETALPPQIFNSGRYCGDYEDFRVAYENDTLDKLLGVAIKRSEENIIDTEYLVEEDEINQSQDDIKDYADELKEIEEVTEVEEVKEVEEEEEEMIKEVEVVEEVSKSVTLNETSLEDKLMDQHPPLAEEPDDNLNVVVTEVHEEPARQVREPEPLNLRPRREPEEVKPRKGRLTQSIQLMMAYQDMYH